MSKWETPAVRLSVLVADNRGRGSSFPRQTARKRHQLKFVPQHDFIRYG
jgi:hypothetical protein